MPKRINKSIKAVFFAPLVQAVLNDKRLKSFDRVLLSLMIQLAKKRGCCFAANKYLAHVFNCSVGSVSKSINKMHKLGYILHNDPNPDDGGRVYHRTMRKDLFFQAEKLDPSHPEYKPWYDEDYSGFSDKKTKGG